MSTQTIFKTAGATSKHTDLQLVQNAGATSPGNALTGLSYNTSGLTAYYRVGATGALTAITLATQTVTGAYSSGGFVEIDSTHAPGGYRFDIPAVCLATAGECDIWFTGAANLATHQLKVHVWAPDMYVAGAGIFTTQMAESYAAAGVAPTPAQALMLIQQMLSSMSWAGAAGTALKLDAATTAATFTANAPVNASGMVRST